MPKVVICLVSGWAAGGGHNLHVTCDLTLASREHAGFKQTDADVGSFDGGYGSAYLAKQVGQKFAREIFFLGEAYTAEQMHQMGAVSRVVDHAELETTGLQWAEKINGKSPQAQRMLKFAFNLLDDGLVGSRSSPARPPGWLYDRRGRGGAVTLSGKARPRLEPIPALLLTAPRYSRETPCPSADSFATATSTISRWPVDRSAVERLPGGAVHAQAGSPRSCRAPIRFSDW